MNNHEFEELLRKKLNVPRNPPADMWERIEKKLDENAETPVSSPKLPYLYRGIAAALLLSIGTTAWYLMQQSHTSSLDSAVVEATNVSKPLAADNNTASPTIIDVQTTSQAQHIGNKYSLSKIVTQNPENPLENKSNIIVTDAPHNIQIDHSFIAEKSNTITQSINNSIHQEENRPNLDVANILNPNYPNESRIATPSQDNTMLIGISGGYNVGSVSNGAAFAFNTRKQINEKVFVDGTLGLVMNNADANLASYNGNYFADQKLLKASNAKARPVINQYASANALYYIQINPSLGYNISKKLDISAGPDYQQMISNTDADVIHFNAERLTKKLPKHDFGLTGKAEFAISPNLKAGIIYREGVSSLLENNNNIQNRRYMQVSLKIQLPIND